MLFLQMLSFLNCVLLFILLSDAFFIYAVLLCAVGALDHGNAVQ
jgi:hypothetical protein